MEELGENGKLAKTRKRVLKGVDNKNASSRKVRKSELETLLKMV